MMKSIARAGVRIGKTFLLVLALCGVLYLARLFLLAHAPALPASQLALAGKAAVTPAATPTTTPAPSAPPSSQTPGNGNPNCTMGVGFLQVNICDRFQAVIESSILDPVRHGAGDTWTQGGRAVFGTDPTLTYANPDIIRFHAILLGVADSLLVLLLLFTGIRMIYEQNILSWSDFKESIPQVLFALLLAHLSLALVGALISLNNVLSTMLESTVVPTLNSLIQPYNQGPLDLAADFVNFVTGLFAILLVAEAIIRLPVLNLCAVLSSLGCLLLVWRPTQRYGSLWLNTLVVAVFAQFLQVLLLGIGAVMIKTLVNSSTPTLAQLAGVAMLFIALALPFYLYRWAVQPVFTAAKKTMDVGDTVAGTVRTAAVMAA